MTVFDKEGAMERVDSDVDLLKELVDICQDEFHKKIPSLRAAVSSGDGTVASELAHSMKSAFGNVGAMDAYQVAFDLERAGKKQETAALIPLCEALEVATKLFFVHFAEIKGSL